LGRSSLASRTAAAPSSASPTTSKGGIAVQEQPQALTDHPVVVGQEQADGPAVTLRHRLALPRDRATRSYHRRLCPGGARPTLATTRVEPPRRGCREPLRPPVCRV
jgi:hypothetical protein